MGHFSRKPPSLQNRLSLFLQQIGKFGSLADQVFVSGGNFLTIAICAHSLPLSEQGKFTYVFASYMALLLLNVAGIFQGAAVRAPAQGGAYQTSLARLQLLQALLLSFLVASAWLGGGSTFGWEATVIEASLLFAFLVVQQLADFDRRAAYIFSGTRRALYSSAALYPLRVVALLIVSPQTASQVLEVLILTALVPAVLMLFTASRRTADGTSWISAAKDHLAYSQLFIAGTPLVWFWANIPVFMLGIMHGKEQVALLASIRGISNVANVLMEQIETKVAADWGRIRHGDSAGHMETAATRLLKAGMIFWLLGMLITLLFGREIVALVLGELYAPHWPLLAIGWLGYGVFFIARILSIKHRTLGANQVEFVGNLSGVFAAIAAGYAIIPGFNATGAAWVYVIIAAVMLIGQILMLKRGRKIEQ